MHKMRKECAKNARECDKDAQKMASQKVPQIVAKSVPLLPPRLLVLGDKGVVHLLQHGIAITNDQERLYDERCLVCS